MHCGQQAGASTLEVANPPSQLVLLYQCWRCCLLTHKSHFLGPEEWGTELRRARDRIWQWNEPCHLVLLVCRAIPTDLLSQSHLQCLAAGEPLLEDWHGTQAGAGRRRRMRLSVRCQQGHCQALKGSAELLHEKHRAQSPIHQLPCYGCCALNPEADWFKDIFSILHLPCLFNSLFPLCF